MSLNRLQIAGLVLAGLALFGAGYLAGGNDRTYVRTYELHNGGQILLNTRTGVIWKQKRGEVYNYWGDPMSFIEAPTFKCGWPECRKPIRWDTVKVGSNTCPHCNRNVQIKK